MTNEIKLTVAAQACILLLHRETDYYPGLDSVRPDVLYAGGEYGLFQLTVR